MFDLHGSKIHRAVAVQKILPTALVRLILRFLLVAAVGLAILWLLQPGFFGGERIFGLLLVVISAIIFFGVYHIFFTTFYSVAALSVEEQYNLADCLDFDAAAALDELQALSKNDLTELLILLSHKPGFHFVCYRLGIDPQDLIENARKFPRSNVRVGDPRAVEFLVSDTLRDIGSTGRRLLGWRDLLVTLSVHSDFLKQYIFERHLDKRDIRAVADWDLQLEKRRIEKKKFWSRDNLLRTRGIGKDWASGFTVHLDRYASDITETIGRRGFNAVLYGRQDTTEAMERILARSGENNVVVVGEAGVGKRTVVYGLAKRIRQGDTLPQLAHKRVLELDIGALLAGASSDHEVEDRVKIVLNDAVKAGNVILMIDEIQSLFERTSAAGTINATELFLPYLSSDILQVVGLTTYGGYAETIAKNPSLLRAFEKVEIHEPDLPTVIQIAQDVIPAIEAHSQVFITYPSLRTAVELSDRYIKNVPFPEKAIDVLQEAAVFARAKGNSELVTPEHVEEVIHRKTEVPVGKIALAEKEVLLDLEKILHRQVVGQDEAIVAIANALRRSRSGVASEKKPIGSFLFLGPTGVGKTETARALAAVYFGSQDRMIRFDMSEYQQPDSLNRLIGYGDQDGLLTSAVTDNPFSLVLFDEAEKSHPNILNLFLQILDDGRLTDALGRTVDFTNTIIIATSNAGAEMIRQSIQGGEEADLHTRLLDSLQKQGIFKPEFLNRFDAAIIFRPLTPEQTGEVVRLLLNDLNRRLATKEVSLRITPELVKKIVAIGYDPQFGARPLRRAIQDRLETVIAKKLLGGDLQRGAEVEVNPEDI